MRAQLEAIRTEGGGTFAATFWANFTANIIRNLWAHSIIFCGHFPDQTYTFGQDEVRDETRGGWYVRQLVGAANITGSPLFHLMSGNLGYQVEHHLFPDMPSSRYAEIAPQVREICSTLRPAVQHRAVLPPARHGPPHDPATRFPGRQAPPEAGPLPGRRGGARRLAPSAPRGTRSTAAAVSWSLR